MGAETLQQCIAMDARLQITSVTTPVAFNEGTKRYVVIWTDTTKSLFPLPQTLALMSPTKANLIASKASPRHVRHSLLL